MALYMSSELSPLQLVVLWMLCLQCLCHQCSVVIIGGGMSGIMAAKTLSDNGVKDFVILEATEKLGGRMRAQRFGSLNVELGANWVEGVNGAKTNPIWKLAQRFNLRTYLADATNISSNIYDESGLLSASAVKEAFDRSVAAWDFASEVGLSRIINNEPDISILTAERLFGHVPSTPVEMALEYFYYDTEFAEPPRVTSLKNTQPNPTFVDFGPNSYMVIDQRGYGHLVHELAATFLASSKDGSLTDPRLQLHKVVNQINYSDNGVEITTEDGSVYNANYTILTVSLGVLQSKLIRFVPDFPAWKIEALFEFDMAIYTKIFLKFPYRFWPHGPGTGNFIYADERRGYYPNWQHLEYEFPGSNILFIKVTDDESRRIEQQPDAHTKAEAMAVLRKMFGENIPEAEDILVARWWSNRFFQGTYSNWPIGVEDYEFQRIKAPVGRVYFAGEHTSRRYNGYVHGAYYSGIEAAQLLLDCMNNGNCTLEVPAKPCRRMLTSV